MDPSEYNNFLMNFFVKNILLIHLVALVVAFGWIQGGTRADLLLPVIPWLTFFILEWLFVFPQAKSTETLVEARLRVWRALRCDPLAYVAVLFIVVLIIPLFNVARPPFFDAVHKQWQNPIPPITWLPYCVDPMQHAVLLLWFPPALIAALAARHGLLKKSKRWLLEFICWNSGALALMGFAQIYTGTTKLLWLTPMESYFFSTFGYPNFAGAFFTLTAALSLGMWFQQVTEKLRQSLIENSNLQDERSWFYMNRMLVPAVLTFLGAFGSLSRAAILLSVLVLMVMFAYMVLYVWRYVTSGVRVTMIASLFAVSMMVAASFAAFKFESLKKEIRNITFSAVVERVTGTGNGYYHMRVAKEIFRDHPLYGVGGWGYPHYQLQHLTPEETRNMQISGGANVHNDALQFLAEQGLVGFGLIFLCGLFLACPPFSQAWHIFRAKMTSETEGDVSKKACGWINRFPVMLVAVSVGTGATVCHSLGDLPFRDPAIMLVWVLAWVCVPGWFPLIKKERAK